MMRKLFYGFIALLAIAACSKESEQPVAKIEKGTRVVKIKASLDAATKTAYENEKTFSWSAGDKISVQVHYTGEATNVSEYDVLTFVTTNGGTIAEFSCDEFPEDYEIVSGGLAFYPASSVSKTFVYNKNNPATVTWGDYFPTSAKANPMSHIPLIGKLKSVSSTGEEYDYQFKTATGIVKVTIANMPEEANRILLAGSTRLTGTYDLDDDNVLKMANIVGTSGYNTSALGISSTSEGEIRSFYFPVPEGTIPAGTELRLAYGSNNTSLISKTLKNDIPVACNTITDLGTITAPSFWTSLGTGKMYDNTVGVSKDKAVDVEIQKSNIFANQYRVVNPYGVMLQTDADPYLKLTVNAAGATLTSGVTSTNDGIVTFNTHNTGYSYSGNNLILRCLNVYTGVTENHFIHSIVLKKDPTSGEPTNIQLAPCYYYTSGTMWNYSYNDVVQIAMPGYDLLDSPLNVYLADNPVSVENGEATLQYSMGELIEYIKVAISAESATEAANALSTDAAITVNSNQGRNGTVTLQLPAEYGKFYVVAKGFFNGYAIESYTSTFQVAAQEASEEYLKWLGDWVITTPRVQSSTEYYDTWTIEEDVKNVSYKVKNFGGNTQSNATNWRVSLEFDSTTGEIVCWNDQVIGEDFAYNSTTYTPVLRAKAIQPGTTKSYGISGKFVVFRGAIDSDGKATLTPGTVSISSWNPSENPVSGVILYGKRADTGGLTYWKTETPLPNVLQRPDPSSVKKQSNFFNVDAVFECNEQSVFGTGVYVNSL